MRSDAEEVTDFLYVWDADRPIVDVRPICIDQSEEEGGERKWPTLSRSLAVRLISFQ